METICIIDDDATMRGFIVASLKHIGYQTIDYESATAFKANYTNEKINLIISDIHMEDVDGVELLLYVKNKNPNIPVILITGGGGYTLDDSLNIDLMQDLVKGMGAETLIQKPINAHKLIKLINNILSSELRKEKPVKCFEFLNCNNIDCSIHKDGIEKCWEHVDIDTQCYLSENADSLNQKENCKRCIYYKFIHFDNE